MNQQFLEHPEWPRRRWLQAMAGGFALAGAPHLGFAQTPSARHGTAPILQGTEFDLTIAEATVNFNGQPRIATLVNGCYPGPTLRWREGDVVTIRVTNRLREVASIHWHGITLPYQMDGTPGISFDGIAPGETFTYRFKVEQHGTYWYHSHSGMQELTGMHGSIIVDPADPANAIRADRDHVVQLSDWSDTDPMRVLMTLRKQSNYYNHNQPTAADFARDVSRHGLQVALNMRQMWNEMRMSPTDLADVSAHALNYLMNGLPSHRPWTGLFRRGEVVRLRFINAAAHTFYDVRVPGLPLQVVAADGVRVEPVTVDELRMGPGETYDVLVRPTDDAHTVFAQSMDRSGFVHGTLAVREGLSAPVPTPDQVVWLSMTDMMGGMDHSAHGGHGQHTPQANPSDANAHAGHAGHGSATGEHASHGGTGDALSTPSTQVRHARTEYGPTVDMRVDMPRTNLDDPGVGLRNNGRRVLTLADLRTLDGPLDPRGPEREIELHLTGHMERYSWSMDGLAFAQSTPVHFSLGERVRVILHNDTMMTHPMHMHGFWQEVETPDGQFQVRKHTVPVQPAQRVSYLMTADAVGRWVWHCHLMFHMEMGMFREVLVT